jgi:hypothetical protein
MMKPDSIGFPFLLMHWRRQAAQMEIGWPTVGRQGCMGAVVG